jgi:hypothetical protein
MLRRMALKQYARCMSHGDVFDGHVARDAPKMMMRSTHFFLFECTMRSVYLFLWQRLAQGNK